MFTNISTPLRHALQLAQVDQALTVLTNNIGRGRARPTERIDAEKAYIRAISELREKRLELIKLLASA